MAASGAAEAAEPAALCGWLYDFDILHPTRKEAIYVTYLSLLACTFFWFLGIIDAVHAHTSAIVATVLESAFDVFSTIAVIMRFSGPDALADTPQNQLSEDRTSVAISASMIGIALVLIFFSTANLFRDNVNSVNRSNLGQAVGLSFPSAVVYLIIGMLQIHLGLVMRVRSLRQDGVISILAAVVSLGALLAALINLMTCEYEEYVDLPSGDNMSTWRRHGIPVLRAVRMEMERVEENSAGETVFLKHSLRYPYYWCEDVITISLAVAILLLGIYSLWSDALRGVRWFTASFWCIDPLPTDTEDGAVTGTVKSSTHRNTEATPLVKQK